MTKQYYLSKFIGTGTESDPFRPLAAQLGRWSMLDLRPDRKRQDGWCFACVELEHEVSLEPATGLIYLCEEALVPLNDAVISAVKASLGIDFKSKKLGEIIAEILLLGRMSNRGLRPELDGSFSINLGGVLWEATEAETYEFVGRLREDELLGAPPRSSEIPIVDVKIALAASLATIAEAVDHGSPTWLEKEMDKVRERRSAHPLATRYLEASELLSGSDPTLINSSSAVVWIMLLARDLRTTGPKIEVARLAPRLRDENDCEPARYELFIMASYIDTGVPLEQTDAGGRGEFRVSVGEQWVHIECKHKNISGLAPRNVKAVFEKGNDLLRELMESKDARCLVQISCRTDPSLEDLPRLTELVSSGLNLDFSETGFQIKRGKFEVSLLPGNIVTADSGVMLPDGFDFGFVRSTFVKKPKGTLGTANGWGVQWRVRRPGGWIRSVVNSIRQAAKQLPPDSPNLVYIHISSGSLGAVATRIDSVEPAIDDLLNVLNMHGRLNAVVLTGQATINGWSGPNTMTVRYVYRTVENRHARNTLPSNFRVFGRDFTRH